MKKFISNFSELERTFGEGLSSGAERLWGAEDRIACEFPNDKGVECSLIVEGRYVSAKCSCDVFAHGKACRHLWAALNVAVKYGDLTKASGKGVASKLKCIFPQEDNGERTYVPEKNAARKRIVCEKDKDGRILECVSENVQAAVKPPVFRPVPIVDRNVPYEIVYILRPDKQGEEISTYVMDTWWRLIASDGQKPQPSKPFIWERETSVKEHIDSRLLAELVPFGNLGNHSDSRSSSEPANRYIMPVGNASFIYLLQDCPRVFVAEVINGSTKMRRLGICLNILCVFEVEAVILPDARVEYRFFMNVNGERISFANIRMVLQAPIQQRGMRPPAFVLVGNNLYQANFNGAAKIAQENIGRERIILDYSDARAFARRLAMETSMSTDALPEAIAVKCEQGMPPTGELFVRTAKYKYKDQEQLHAELSFNYDGISCPDDYAERSEGKNSVIIRDAATEANLRERLLELGFRYNTKAYVEELGWKLVPSKLDEVVSVLVQENWIVTAEGKSYRKPISKQMSIKSGIDWFSVEGFVAFDGKEIPIPELLSMARNGQKSVRLDDGTFGVLPIEWLANFTVLTEIGEVDNDRIRFRAEQAALVSSILNERAEEASGSFGERLKDFEQLSRVSPALPPDGFQATLRPYQEIGLGWLLSMQKAGLGACLADDMGLGKTIQVLALLGLRSRLPERGPSLIVLPRSLIFNWKAEAAKFAPWMRVIVHLGSGRTFEPSIIQQADIVLTTYGTLRNDATKLAQIDFDYCVLDESQAIKNYDSSTAKAARCIKAHYRIAMTGTPIENHLGELFSQLEFLNPGLFGRLRSIPIAPSASSKRDDSIVRRVRNGVRPFILRRTKQEVAKELPPKTEQILLCEMLPEDQSEYDELLKYYQNEILGTTQSGTGMQVLAALTRLRQAACHPGLLKASRIDDTSAKLELLMANLETILGAGHKALVFSQFTSFLKIIASRLEECGYGFSYLDGETRDRASVVDSFQNDVQKQVFLISLKAGGVGLNLTAADYVFIMDPWWNPATEAQAIDRAYRIGQTNPVMAYRLVTKNTIEEKVVLLQNYKRELATSVIDGEVPDRITAKDLLDLLRN